MDNLNYYRISKYDPQNRINGIYPKDEWTAISDVGKTYNGTMFTQEEYDHTENNYCAFMLDILREQSINRLEISYLENPNRLDWGVGQTLSFAQIVEFVRNCLREECWGQLTATGFIFECGYDFYIHIACLQDITKTKAMAQKHDLFVEEYDALSLAPYTE